MKHRYQRVHGFTLIELMVVMVIVAIFAAVAIPSYQQYVRRSIAAQTQQEMQKLAEQLERHRSKNFSYRGFNPRYLYPVPPSPRVDSFDPSTQKLTLPLESSTPKYTLVIMDGARGNPLLTSSSSAGQSWIITATSDDVRNFSYLLTSAGIQCKTLTPANIETDLGADLDDPNEIGCGEGGEDW